MRVCVIGSGAREHALADVLGRTAEVVVTPGRDGIAGSTAAPAEEIEADLYVVGPEQPLVEGLADRLRAAGHLVLGPGADGARLEASKAWAKALMDEAGVPTARYGAFSDEAAAIAFLEEMEGPFVVKADGLAGGKGVLVTESRQEAAADVREKLAGRAFGQAGRTVVIEEGMSGEELTVLVLTDGQRLAVLPPSQDHKRVGDGDLGPNTGGMGAYSPVPSAAKDVVEGVVDEAVAPTLAALRRRGIDYRGVIYAGMMLTPDGPRVVEFNVRFGDPEAQVVLPLLDGDVAELLAQAAAGALRDEPLIAPGACLTVVMCSEGYPVEPRIGDRIVGIEEAEAIEGVTVYRAGTATGPLGYPVTASGRVLSVTGRGADLGDAHRLAYEGVARISWPGAHWRSDIGERSVGGKPSL
ncbi:MAG TPA: phosphoribosylamine--glycine ligase [Acidimicrobiales bacterium]|nr:phosphoribosylamine--glycine ligase [Acidimicrobiales bacterium]